MRLTCLLAILATLLPAETPDPWKPLRFMIGEWTGEGNGAPGEGSGGFSLQLDLQGKILVRKNWADYPATKDRAASRHDDLMIIYVDQGSKGLRATYFDSEGHAIFYSVDSAEGSIRFLSDAASAQPRYRMIYRDAGDGKMTFDFDIAPPGKPEAFANYVKATLRKRGAK